MQGNARGTYGSGCKLPGEYSGMPGELMGMGANCQRNAWKAGECQGNVWEWVYSARGMQGNTRGMHGNTRGMQRTTRGMQGSGCKVLAE